jgi:hypothetical protein
MNANNGWNGSSRALEEEQVELDGLRVVFDQKVGLFAANMQKKIAPKKTGSGVGAPARRRQAEAWSYGRR